VAKCEIAEEKSMVGRQGLLVSWWCLLGGQLVMNLAVEIAGSVLGEHASNAHHPSGYTNERRLIVAPFFAPETTETPIKAKRSAPREFSHWPEKSFTERVSQIP